MTIVPTASTASTATPTAATTLQVSDLFVERVDALARHRVAAKAPHVAPPQNEVAELGPEGRVKVRMRRHQLHRSIE